MEYKGLNNEYFEVVDINPENTHHIKKLKNNWLALLWFESDENKIIIDSKPYKFNTNELICVTEFHHLQIIDIKKLKLLIFNRPFFCVLDHDQEIGCKGILYYGASQLPILRPTKTDVEVLKAVWNVLYLEMKFKDNLQLEMLQMLLKRILILCTRIYKNQENYSRLDQQSEDIVREFNFLVETHFRQKHTVSEYATLMNKSPKTLSNLFKKLSNKSPLQFIKERLMLEARRLLRYSNKTISEIGYEIGFNDVQTFSRFFKSQEGISPIDFRNEPLIGKIANT